jgi:hypothetical protein
MMHDQEHSTYITHKGYFANLPLAFLFINKVTRHWKFNNIKFRILIMLFGFMQVLNHLKKHPTKNEHFQVYSIFYKLFITGTETKS